MSFTKKFQTEFQKLNSAQREAAENIEGPLLIVAGPGTGKTQTLALRLANILAKTHARPHNLLALTFTESGAIALKKRLASVIGSEAFGISAFTFHAFCARLHSTFPSEFATTRERIQIDELRQIQLFREILEHGNFPLLAPLRAPDLYLRDLRKALSDLKREGIAPQKFLEIIEDEKAIINAGSVGQPRDKDNRASYVYVDQNRVNFVRLEYDYETTMQKIKAIESLDDFHADRLRDGR